MKSMVRTLKMMLILALSVPLLSGCWDRVDPENMAFIVAIGVDPGPKNDYLFTFALAVPKPVNASGGGSQSPTNKKLITVYTVESSNIASALVASQSFIARRLTLIHAKAFIFGESIARKGLMPILSEVVRNREFRRSMYVMTTRGDAETFIQNILPTTETDISLWIELELDPNDMGSLIPIKSRFNDFILDIESAGTGAITIQASPRLDIRKGLSQMPSEGSDSSSSGTSQPIIGKQHAGKIRRYGEIPLEFYGSAIYKGSKLAGFLDGSETLILNMLTGSFKKSIWDFPDPSDSSLNISMIVSPEKQTRMHVQRKNDKVHIAFDIDMEGDLVSVQSKVDFTKPENTKRLERLVQKQLLEQSNQLISKLLHKWESDCFRINNYLKSTFSTLKEWEDFNWREHIKDVEYEANISFKMRRYGDQVGPAIEGDVARD